MASAANFRPDRAILKRQKDEARFEKLLADNKSAYVAESYAVWENKTGETIHKNRISNRVGQLLEQNREVQLDERRKKLANLLKTENDE